MQKMKVMLRLKVAVAVVVQQKPLVQRKITVTLKKQIVKKLALLAVLTRKAKDVKTAHYSKASISQQLL